jgi:hypothetical protein
MTKEHKGHYAAKHPKGMQPEQTIAREVESRASSDRLACAEATRISGDLDVTMMEIGTAADLMEVKIVDCQLGLLGRNRSDAKAPQMAPYAVPPKMKESILKAEKNGCLTCKAAWDIAIELGCARMDVAKACDALKIKVSSCQLGAF